MCSHVAPRNCAHCGHSWRRCPRRLMCSQARSWPCGAASRTDGSGCRRRPWCVAVAARVAHCGPAVRFPHDVSPSSPALVGSSGSFAAAHGPQRVRNARRGLAGPERLHMPPARRWFEVGLHQSGFETSTYVLGGFGCKRIAEVFGGRGNRIVVGRGDYRQDVNRRARACVWTEYLALRAKCGSLQLSRHMVSPRQSAHVSSRGARSDHNFRQTL